MPVTVQDLPPDPEDRPWLRRILFTTAGLLLLAGLAFGAYKMGIYGTKRGEEKLQESTAGVDVEFLRPPAWLPPQLISSLSNPDSLVMDVLNFTRLQAIAATPTRPALTNYQRMQNPQEVGVLRDLAGYLQNETNLHNRAWIKSIRSIRRESDRARNIEHIIIDAEFRAPLAFVAQGENYYLVEKVTTSATGQKQAIRLPGAYTIRERRLMADYPCVTGIDSATPEPGQAFTSPGAIAGLELAAVLAKQPYIRQIAAINVSNYDGRRETDPLKPFITLETVYASPSDPREPTRVWWGRPLGEEQFFEVHSPAKLGYLTRLFIKYNRIDAGQDWVDIRGDQPIIPMAKSRSEVVPLADNIALASH